MIISDINNNIKYESPEENEIVIYPIDEDYDADTYEIEVDGNKVDVAVGNVNKDDPFHLVKYCHVYLLKQDKVIDRIGVVEMNHEEEDNDDIDLEDHVLYFNKPRIKKLISEHMQFGGKEQTISVNKETPEEKMGIKIKGKEGEEKKIIEVASAKFDFKVGDIILQINGEDVINKSTSDIIKIFKSTNKLSVVIDRAEEAGSKEEVSVKTSKKDQVCDFIPKPKESLEWNLTLSAEPAAIGEKGAENLLFQDAVHFLCTIKENIVSNLKTIALKTKQKSPETPTIEEAVFQKFESIFKTFEPSREDDLESRKTLPVQNYQSFIAQKNDFEQNFQEIASSKIKSKSSVENLWINYLFKDLDYDVINPPADGDCLFYTIQKAFHSIGIYISVKQLRELQRFSISYEVLKDLHAIVGPWTSEVKTKEKEIKKISEEYRQAFSQKGKIPIKILKPQLIEIKENYNTAVKQLNKLITDENPIPNDSGDIGFFKREQIIDDNGDLIGDLDYHFGKFIDYKINNDWADENTLIAIANIFKIKIIILELNSVKRELNSNGASNVAKYVSIRGDTDNPHFYLFINLTGGHFQLITYKNKALFKINEIPYTLKFMIRQNLLMLESEQLTGIVNHNFSELEQTIAENKLESVYELKPWGRITKILSGVPEAHHINETETAGQFTVAPQQGSEIPVTNISNDLVNRLFANYRVILQTKNETEKNNLLARSKEMLQELLGQQISDVTQRGQQHLVVVENMPAKIDLTNIMDVPF